MARKPRCPDGDPTPLQLELLNLAWEDGEITVAEAHRRLAARRPVARTTVLTLLRRLEERGWLAHRAVGRTFHYRATRGRDASVGSLLGRLRDTVFGGSTEGLVSTLLRADGASPGEIRRLQILLRRIGKERP